MKTINDLNLTDYSVTELDLSYQEIDLMDGIEKFEKLISLKLEGNKINRIQGLESLVDLQELNLIHNEISEISSLSSLNNLNVLVLSYNKIQKIEGLEELYCLRNLDLSFNEIDEALNLDLDYLPIEIFNLQNNKISEIEKICLPELKILDLSKNEIELNEYNLEGIKKLSELKNFERLHLFLDYEIKELNISQFAEMELRNLSFFDYTIFYDRYSDEMFRDKNFASKHDEIFQLKIKNNNENS
ncbi:leucine-rich repeat domain-containing protein [Aureivirga sp. CE67]|uniref:leucine-rich repeat domain-containing protein n=1 Tax=Aureivirga sp. CE67 TaxID=1788983 RepID=UPI0018CB5D2B|nr:hypothetical protein [Aureivirga sp. CE67]